MTSKIQLYDYYRSSSSFRVRIALNFKKLEFETIPVHLMQNGGEQHSVDYKKMNPQQLVPALIVKDNVLTQSLAIIEYLEECYPLPPLLPKDPYQKSLIRAFALAIAADLQPLNNLRVLNFLTEKLQVPESDKMLWYRHWIATSFAALETQMQQHAGDFCYGNTLSLADIYLVPQMYNARRFECDLSLYPTLCRVDANAQQLPAVQESWPEAMLA